MVRTERLLPRIAASHGDGATTSANAVFSRPPAAPTGGKESRVSDIWVSRPRAGTGGHRRCRHRDPVPDLSRTCHGLRALPVHPCGRPGLVVGHHSQHVGRTVTGASRCGVVTVHDRCVDECSDCSPGWFVSTDRRRRPRGIASNHDPTDCQGEFGCGGRIALGNHSRKPDLDRSHPNDQSHSHDHGSERGRHGSDTDRHEPTADHHDSAGDDDHHDDDDHHHDDDDYDNDDHYHDSAGDDDHDRPGPVHGRCRHPILGTPDFAG